MTDTPVVISDSDDDRELLGTMLALLGVENADIVFGVELNRLRTFMGTLPSAPVSGWSDWAAVAYQAEQASAAITWRATDYVFPGSVGEIQLSMNCYDLRLRGGGSRQIVSRNKMFALPIQTLRLSEVMALAADVDGGASSLGESHVILAPLTLSGGSQLVIRVGRTGNNRMLISVSSVNREVRDIQVRVSE